jgi:hypothetical protein
MSKIADPGDPPTSFKEKDKWFQTEISSAMIEAMKEHGMNNLESIGFAVLKTGCTVQEARWVRQLNMYTFQRP